MIKAVLITISLAFAASFQATATVVEIRTNLGNISVNLFDEDTPETVGNFLEYVNSGAYANNVVHRMIPNFVVQGGGFQYNNELPFDNVATGVAVTNEPELSNLRGTIAMAKLEGNPNSATSQWYINLADNSQNLDVTNGGFTVFGQVIGDGMDVVDQIAALTRYNMGGALNSIPLIDFANDGTDPSGENFVLITDIVVTDPATVTNPDLNPAPNTLIDSGSGNGGGSNPPPPTSSGSSGGAINPLALFCLGGLALFLRRQKRSR